MKNRGLSYHHGNLRSALVDAALERLERGERVTALSVRVLAVACGVSAGAPYRHFPSSDSLIAAVATRGFEMLDASLAGSRDLVDMGVAYVRFAHRHPELYRAMFHFPQRELGEHAELAAAAEATYERLAAIVRGGAHAETGGAERVVELSAAAWAFVHGVADLVVNEYTTTIDPDDDESLRALIGVVARGVERT